VFSSDQLSPDILSRMLERSPPPLPDSHGATLLPLLSPPSLLLLPLSLSNGSPGVSPSEDACA